MGDDRISPRVNADNENSIGHVQRVEEDGDMVQCPLCVGRGKLSRTFLYDQLGVRDMAKLATHTAKQAVEEVTTKLWQQYKENLGAQVKAESETLNREIARLHAEHTQLEARNKALESSIGDREKVARATQRNEDRESLLAEKNELQDLIANLKGELEQARAKLTAAENQRTIDVQGAASRVKDDEANAREELRQRIDKMNDALTEERRSKAELQTKLERALNEGKQRQLEAREAALKEAQIGLDQKSKTIDELKDQLAQANARLETIPEKERLAKQAAIQDKEGQLRKLELDRDNLQTERDRLRDELEEARRKLEESKGKVEERTFEETVSVIPGVWIEETRSQKKSGDYHVGLFDKDGQKLSGSKIIVDNKDVVRLTDKEIEKLVRDALHHGVALAAMVVRDEGALRPKDKDARFQLEGGVTVLRTTREWFSRDLDLLRPLMRRQAEEGPDFLTRNVAVAAEVRSHMKSIDEIERLTRLARENSEKAETEIRKYRSVIEQICRSPGRSSQPDGKAESF